MACRSGEAFAKRKQKKLEHRKQSQSQSQSFSQSRGSSQWQGWDGYDYGEWSWSGQEWREEWPSLSGSTRWSNSVALVAASDGGVEDVSVALVAASDGGVEDGVALEAISPLVSLLAGDKFTRFSLTLSFRVGWQVLLASAFGGGDLCTTVFCAPVLDVEVEGGEKEVEEVLKDVAGHAEEEEVEKEHVMALSFFESQKHWINTLTILGARTWGLKEIVVQYKFHVVDPAGDSLLLVLCMISKQIFDLKIIVAKSESFTVFKDHAQVLQSIGQAIQECQDNVCELMAKHGTTVPVLKSESVVEEEEEVKDVSGCPPHECMKDPDFGVCIACNPAMSEGLHCEYYCTVRTLLAQFR